MNPLSTAPFSFSDSPEEILVHIFNQLTIKYLKTLDCEDLMTLNRCSRINHQWFRIIEEFFSNIFFKRMGTREFQQRKSWMQAVSLLRNWTRSRKIFSCLVTKPRFESTIKVETFIEIGNRFLFNHGNLLLSGEFNRITNRFKVIWKQPLEAIPKGFMVSLNPHLFAIQSSEYKTNKTGQWHYTIFSIYHFASGCLLGKVELVHPPKKCIPPKLIEFDWTHLIYQRKGKTFILRYD